MRPTVLLFNISDAKRGTVKLIAMRLGIQCVSVSRDKYGMPLESILSGIEQGPDCQSSEIPEEMAVLCNFSGVLFNRFLDELRRKKAGIALKAVLTDSNRSWSPGELYTELCRERDAIAAGEKAHG